MAFGLGLVLIGLGWRAAPPTPSSGRRPWAAVNDLSVPHPSRAASAVGVALVVLVVTHWPVLAVSAAAATWWYLNSRGKDQGTAIERTEAIAAWAEMLADATGTARGIEGVLVSTADTAPLPIRSHVVRFTRRLTYETLEDALPDLADDLDDPNGDLIVAALRLAAASGGRDLRSVLDDVALAARDEARMRRRVEVSRERPRSDMRQVIVAIVVVIVLLILGPSRDYLTPYSSLGGQLVMSVAAAFWIGGLGAMARLARVPPLQRILTRTEETR
jgi:Flp pilus assembly protein TadB